MGAFILSTKRFQQGELLLAATNNNEKYCIFNVSKFFIRLYTAFSFSILIGIRCYLFLIFKPVFRFFQLSKKKKLSKKHGILSNSFLQ